MSNNSLKGKIQSTRLFSDAEKIAILVRLEEFSEDEVKKFEGIIDVYDRKHSQLVARLKTEVETSLGSLDPDQDSQEVGDAQVLIRAGIHTLSS